MFKDNRYDEVNIEDFVIFFSTSGPPNAAPIPKKKIERENAN